MLRSTWMSGFVVAGIAATAPAYGCPSPPERWTQASANGAYEFIVEPAFYSAREGWRHLEGATYRLERVGARREVVWEVRSREFYSGALVANDGDYVVTAGPWFGGEALTIRNSAGAVIRSLVDEDLVSVAERLEGAEWSLKELDTSQEYLEVEVSFHDGSDVEQRSTSRRIQLMDGYVLDPPKTPAAFEIPELACALPATLRMGAGLGELWLVCIDDARGHRANREYAFENGQFSLVEYGELDGRDGRGWRSHNAENEPGACETFYRDGELISERCGPDVARPAE